MRKARILVADDNADRSHELLRKLIHLGYKISAVCATPHNIRAALTHTIPEIIFMQSDQMSKENGIAIAMDIYNQNIPLIILSDVINERIKRAMEHIPHAGYLTPPIDESKLQLVTESALTKYELNKELKHNLRWYTSILNTIQDTIVVTDVRGNIRYINYSAELLTNKKSEELQGKLVHTVFQITECKNGCDLNDILKQVPVTGSMTYSNGGNLSVNNTKSIPVEIHAQKHKSLQGKEDEILLVFRDVQEQRTLQRELEYASRHDSLIPWALNRSGLKFVLESLSKKTEAKKEIYSLLFIDLDDFKNANDFGHDIGDAVLQHVFEIIRETVRETDIIVRWGGDECVVILVGCSDTYAQEVAEAIRTQMEKFSYVLNYRQLIDGLRNKNNRFVEACKISQEMLDKLSEFIGGSDTQIIPSLKELGVTEVAIPCTASIGVMCGSDIASMIKEADAACHSAKRAGKNQVTIITAENENIQVKRAELHISSELEKAIKGNGFELMYQKIKPLKNQTEYDVWFEVLLRMRDEDGNLVKPVAFLGTAERRKWITQIDDIVLRMAFEFLNKNKSARSLCFVNISNMKISNPYFPKQIEALSKYHKVPLSSIAIEIPERFIINSAVARQNLPLLRSYGCKISVDGFGSGDNSLRRIGEFEVDYLKIDGSFITKMSLQEEIIVRAIVEIAALHSQTNERRIAVPPRRIETIAMCVETSSVAAQLETLGLDFAQGYLYGEPELLSSKVWSQAQ